MKQAPVDRSTEEGVGGVFVGVVVGADDDAVDVAVGEDFHAVQVPAVVVGGERWNWTAPQPFPGRRG